MSLINFRPHLLPGPPAKFLKTLRDRHCRHLTVALLYPAMKCGNARQHLARKFDAILHREVSPFASDEIAQPLQAPSAIVDLPIADALIGVGRLRNENPVLATFIPVAEI